MAKILENPHGGRRMIRLSSEDIISIVSLVQREFRRGPATPKELETVLTKRPFYLPEESA